MRLSAYKPHRNHFLSLVVILPKMVSIVISPRAALAMAACLTASVALGAQVTPGDFASLLKEASATGTVRVLVTIDDTVTLATIKNNPAVVRAAMEQKAKLILSELGQEVLESGYWNNGLGQIGFYVTPNGLKILAGSANAKAFMPDVTSKLRFLVHDSDGSLDAIDAAINAKGFADVEVFLNVDYGDYDIGKDGKTTFKSSSGLSNQITTRLNNVKAQKFTKGFRNLDTSPAQAAVPSPSFRARIDKNAFYGLRESSDVRAIRPVGFVDARPAHWAGDILATAQANGSAEVMISLRGGSLFSPKTGYMSATALKAQTDANQRAFDDVLSSAGTSLSSSAAATYLGLGSVSARLPYAVLARLYNNADPRILSIELNKPAAWAALTNSTGLMNMQPYWNAGYRAAGQNIVVIDSGIRKDHELFKMNGATKVVYEACFGSNALSGGVQYNSICPSQDANGDTFPQGQLGSGEPFNNLAVCASLELGNQCSHGTHVAGIAAGHSSPNVSPSALQGVAPDALLISAQVFSYNATIPAAGAFPADIHAALNAVYAATTLGTNNPYVVNMSIGGAVYSSDCRSADTQIADDILNLTSRGVPVVIATGNNGGANGTSGNTNGISWPACSPQAIKVAAVINDSAGTSLAGFANIGNPANFTGPILMAPGGGGGTLVNSAGTASTTATRQMAGTSQATPHAAGVYAALKVAFPGISVADATSWIVTTGSISVTYVLPAPVGTQTYRRLRLP